MTILEVASAARAVVSKCCSCSTFDPLFDVCVSFATAPRTGTTGTIWLVCASATIAVTVAVVVGILLLDDSTVAIGMAIAAPVFVVLA